MYPPNPGYGGTLARESLGRLPLAEGGETADEVGGAVDTQILESSSGEGRTETLVADENHALVGFEVDDPVRTRGCEAPFEHGQIDHGGTVEWALGIPQGRVTYIDNHRTGVDFTLKPIWRHAIETTPRLSEDLVERRQTATRCVRSRHP
jgi:hypothetical protein